MIYILFSKIKNKQTFLTFLFISCFVLGGADHIADRLFNMELVNAVNADDSMYLAFGSTALFVLNFGIYAFLIIWWIQSVYTRLLPSYGRTDGHGI